MVFNFFYSADSTKFPIVLPLKIDQDRPSLFKSDNIFGQTKGVEIKFILNFTFQCADSFWHFFAPGEIPETVRVGLLKPVGSTLRSNLNSKIIRSKLYQKVCCPRFLYKFLVRLYMC